MQKAEKKSASRTIKIANESGLHARPASEFVRCVMRFKSEITLRVNGKQLSGISIMDIMTADIRKGAELEITAEGVDADRALDALEKTIHDLPSKGF